MKCLENSGFVPSTLGSVCRNLQMELVIIHACWQGSTNCSNAWKNVFGLSEDSFFYGTPNGAHPATSLAWQKAWK
jgi:hypothetical protein